MTNNADNKHPTFSLSHAVFSNRSSGEVDGKEDFRNDDNEVCSSSCLFTALLVME